MAQQRTRTLAEVVERLDRIVDRLEGHGTLTETTELTPAQRQQAEIDGARYRARNWARALPDRTELEAELRHIYRNNTEALLAAMATVEEVFAT